MNGFVVMQLAGGRGLGGPCAGRDLLIAAATACVPLLLMLGLFALIGLAPQHGHIRIGHGKHAKSIYATKEHRP